MDVAEWLNDLGLGRYLDIFRENEIDSEILPTLDADDLNDLGVTIVGHRRKMMNAIAALREEAAETAPASPQTLTLPAAERRQLTVLFCDLVASTELSRRLDPEDLADVMRNYQDVCKRDIERWGGHVAKYLGDGVLAYFGYPEAHEDDAERAVRAGLDLTDAVGALPGPEGESLACRVGIATGLVMVGELIGEGASQEETVVGETPNLAARLEALAKRGTVTIAPQTRKLLGDLFDFDDLGMHMLKGFAEPIQVWGVIGAKSATSRFEARTGQAMTPLVGREHEIALLGSLWCKASAGQGQVALISGEPGIGKSRLTSAVREKVSDQSVTLLRYQCSPFYTNSALQPVIEQLERAAAFGRGDDDETKVDKLERLLETPATDDRVAAALLGTLLDLPVERYPTLNLSPQRHMDRTLDVLVHQLQRLAQRQPVVVLFEDLHWSDPTSLELLDRLVERIERLSVLALFTYRPEFQPAWIGQAHVHAIILNRLTTRQGAAIVDKVARDRALPEQVTAEIVKKADGVPLFVEELTKTILESDLLSDVGDRLVLKRELPPLAIPSSLQDSLTARLDRFAPVKEIIQIGAVIGREFPYRLLALVSEFDHEKLNGALHQLTDSGLIFCRGAPPDAIYIFKHALIQEAAYQTLLKARRQHYHVEIAHRLLEQFPDVVEHQPELLAHHFTQAQQFEQAIEYWCKAGQKAGVRNAHVEAVAHLEQGLLLASSLPASLERDRIELDLLGPLGQFLIITKGYSAPEVERAYLRARSLCENLRDDLALANILTGLCTFHQVGGDLFKAREVAESALKAARKSRDTGVFLAAQMNVGVVDFFLGDFASAQPVLEQAVQLADQEPVTSTLVAGHPRVNNRSFLSLVQWMLGRPDQAIRLSQEAVTIAESLGHPYVLANNLIIAASLQFYLRDVVRTQELAERGLAIADAHGFEFWTAIGSVYRGWCLAMQQDFEGGASCVRKGLETARTLGATVLQTTALFIQAEASLRSGRKERVNADVSELLTLIGKTGERRLEAEANRIEGDVFQSLSPTDEERAKACYERAIAVAQSQNAKSWELRAAMSLAQLWISQGQRQMARDVLSPIYGWFTEGFETPDLKEAKALLGQLS